jgi:hypothetical protein
MREWKALYTPGPSIFLGVWRKALCEGQVPRPLTMLKALQLVNTIEWR